MLFGVDRMREEGHRPLGKPVRLFTVKSGVVNLAAVGVFKRILEPAKAVSFGICLLQGNF